MSLFNFQICAFKDLYNESQIDVNDISGDILTATEVDANIVRVANELQTTYIANGGVLYCANNGTDNSVVLGKNLTNGQLLIGSTGNSPVAATLTGTTNQVIITNSAGAITLSLPQSIATSSNVQFNSATLAFLTLVSGVGSSLIQAQNTGSYTYTVPTVGASANFVLDQGFQQIHGEKDFYNVPKLIASYLQLGDIGRVDNIINFLRQYVPGGGNYTIDFANTGSSRDYVIPDTGTASSIFMMCDGAQIVNGSTIFDGTGGNLQIRDGGVATTGYIIKSTTPAATRTYSLPDMGLNTNFVLTDGAQTLSNKTLASPAFSGNITGTINMSADPAISVIETSATAIGYKIQVSGDTNFRFASGGDGTLYWTNGSAGTDVNLSRGGTKTLAVANSTNDAIFKTTGVIIGEHDVVGYGSCGLQLQAHSNPNLQLAMGVDTSNVGFIQSLNSGIAYTNLHLQPNGANVEIGQNGVALGGLIMNNAIASYAPTALNYYEEGNVLFTFQGPMANTNSNVDIVRVGRKCTLYFEGFTATANGVATTISTTTAIPARFRRIATTRAYTQPIWTVSNGVGSLGYFACDSLGNITIYYGATPGNFSAVGTANGFDTFSVHWLTA